MYLDPDTYRYMQRHDFLAFVEGSFGVLNPQTAFVRNPHLEIMAAKLEECRQGKVRRLIINVPPRSLKSIMASVCFPAFVLGHTPGARFVCASYSQDLAAKHALDTRNLIRSRYYQKLFPWTRISNQKMAANDFAIDRYHGERLATSLGGTLTGRGGEYILIDDPMKPDEALSSTQRQKVKDWYDTTLYSRLNDKERGVIILIMQRLHVDDLVGHLLEKGGWEVLKFPAIAEMDEVFEAETILGPFRFTRKAGEALDQVRESLATLAEIRRTLGSYNFQTQYQQDPKPFGGAMVKTEWLQYYEPHELPAKFLYVIQSWDTANKSGELNDYSVCTTWGYKDGKFYLLDLYRKRVEYPDLRRALESEYKKRYVNAVLIEDKASGTQLIQEAKAVGVTGVLPYCPPAGVDKVMRLHMQTALFEAGNVYLPRNASWLKDYVDELAYFPTGRYDDQVDSTTQALEYLAEKGRVLSKWAKLGS
jgi:predicted phage terminase large subunit-like protein